MRPCSYSLMRPRVNPVLLFRHGKSVDKDRKPLFFFFPSLCISITFFSPFLPGVVSSMDNRDHDMVTIPIPSTEFGAEKEKPGTYFHIISMCNCFLKTRRSFS